MKRLDLSNLDDVQFEVLEQFLLNIRDKGFTRRDFDYRRWQMDLALKQEFQTMSIERGTYQDYNLVESDLDVNPGDEPDAYSDLYVPLLLKFFRASLINMSNLCFPANGDWLNITRKFSDYFYKSGIENFLPFVNDAWVNILKTENQRFGYKEVYKSSMAEDISYGNTVLGHRYNPDTYAIEPFAPGIGTVAMWPVTSEWKKSNLCMYYDVNYAELMGREDLDQEIIAEIEPSVGSDSRTGFDGSGSTRIKEAKETNVPFGEVRLHDFYIPSFYARGKNNEIFIGKGMFLTVAINPRIKSGSKIKHRSVYILKATEDVKSYEHGILLATFGTNLPSVFYSQGLLQPFLPQQYIANQLFSEASRSVGMTTDPPKSITGSNGLMIDPNETPIPDFVAGGVFPNMKIELAIDPMGIAQCLDTFLKYISYLERNLEEGLGISKQIGAINQGSKSTSEVRETYSGQQMNFVEMAARYDEQELRPSSDVRLVLTQSTVRDQVESAVQATLEDSAITDVESVYEEVLSSNPMFRRLLNFCTIQPDYENYYKQAMEDYLQDQALIRELEQMSMQIQQALAFSLSPIPPLPEVPQVRDPQTGAMVPTIQEIEMLKKEWYTGQQQERMSAGQKAKDLELEIETKKLTFKDAKVPPEPSLKLYYEMLIAPVSNSDIVVTGSMTTVSKELARENLAMLMASLPQFPPATTSKVDYDNLLMMLGRVNDVPLRELLKDRADVVREEIAAEKQAQFDQELQMRMAENPGAATPKPASNP